jgi:cysteine protease ATG4
MNDFMWFSYKRNWLMPIEGTSISSDVGWGCMVRCGQMLLAKCLIRISQASLARDPEVWKSILVLFQENLKDEDAPYSIQNLVPHAKKEFNIQPGEWFRATSIMMSLDKMTCKYKNPLNCNLKIMTSVESIIGMNEIHATIFGEKDRKGKVDYSDELCKRDWNTQLLLCVAIRIGLNKPQENFKGSMAHFMSLRHCIGMLGGKDHKAYFIVGYNAGKQKYYYLDPHYVQVRGAANSRRRTTRGR